MDSQHKAGKNTTKMVQHILAQLQANLQAGKLGSRYNNENRTNCRARFGTVCKYTCRQANRVANTMLKKAPSCKVVLALLTSHPARRQVRCPNESKDSRLLGC
jgi:hypothetical protein